MTWKASKNISRRNIIKILGLPEDKLKEESWDDTDELVTNRCDKKEVKI